MSTRKIIFLLYGSIALVLSLLLGSGFFGYSVDYINYLNVYDSVANKYYFDEARYEIGFLLILKLFKVIFDISLLQFIGISAFVTLLSKYFYLSQFKSFLLPLVFTVCFFVVHEFTQIRTSIALCLVLVGLHFHLQNDRKKAYVLMILAVFFQYASVLFIASTLLFDMIFRNSKHIFLPYLLLAGLIFLTIQSALNMMALFNPLILVYIDSKFQMNIYSIRMVFVYSIWFISILSLNKLNDHGKLLLLFLTVFTSVSIGLYKIPVLSIRFLEVGLFSAFVLIWLLPGYRGGFLKLISVVVSGYIFYKEYIFYERISFLWGLN